MREYRYILADVFTDRIFGGNPLAVFPSADGMDATTMQAVARELNLSESVFVTRADGADAALRIFTPRMELPFAGHPTLGAACMLAEEGMLAGGNVTFLEAVGAVGVRIESADTGHHATLTTAVLPEEGPAAPAPEALARLLSIEPPDIDVRGRGPAQVSCGVPFTFVPVRDRSVLARVRLAPGEWAELLAGAWAPHVYVLTTDAEGADAQVRARMFAPAMGIPEDPATGAAAAALAGYLGRDLPDGTHRWRVEQGFEMGRPSHLDVAADRSEGVFTAVRVGGRAVRVGHGMLRVP